jgi:PPOX class probable FMN-dependent enzyme
MPAADPTTAVDRVITTTVELAELYRAPSKAVLDKETTILDQGCRDFLARSPFVLVGTSDRDGNLDVSPRGGPPGFVKVLDEHRLAIPDLGGNNRLDSIRNIVQQGHIGLLFIIPGLGETLRVNGRACLTADPEILDRFTDDVRRPKAAIGVTVEHGFIHCAKATRRSRLWDPETWPDADSRPSAGDILVAHGDLGEVLTGAELDELLEQGYRRDLAAERPEGS